ENTTINNFILWQNFPNPFNPVTKIRYEIRDYGFVTLKIYNILGSEVATLVNDVKHAGVYEVNFNATGLPSGTYFYTLTADGPSTGSGQVFTETKKLVLLK